MIHEVTHAAQNLYLKKRQARRVLSWTKVGLNLNMIHFPLLAGNKMCSHHCNAMEPTSCHLPVSLTLCLENRHDVSYITYVQQVVTFPTMQFCDNNLYYYQVLQNTGYVITDPQVKASPSVPSILQLYLFPFVSNSFNSFHDFNCSPSAFILLISFLLVLQTRNKEQLFWYQYSVEGS